MDTAEGHHDPASQPDPPAPSNPESTTTTSPLDPASSPSASTDSPSASETTGLSAWEARRASWTKGHKPYSPHPPPAPDWFKSNPALADVDESHFDAIYKSLVDGRRFAKPVPLPFVVSVLIHGWKKEGLWHPTTGLGSNYADEQQKR
ncbi:hypothetical protein DFS34DRAFT_313985 [Phlyctochytrium arcticum]|nr:hypothetical protein DFS34DRAFT_313985 [Phlyctochytrium arcticum]